MVFGHVLTTCAFFEGRRDLLQIPPGAGEKSSEIQQSDEEQTVVFRVLHAGAVLQFVQEPPRGCGTHSKLLWQC